MRSTHKTELQTLLSTVTFEAASLAVEKYYISTADRYPFVFITSGGLNPNADGGSQYEIGPSGTYKRVYTYNIVCVFKIPEDSIESEEARIDTLEGLILDKLQGESARNNDTWLDLQVREVSPTYDGRELSLDENEMAKIFTVEISALVDMPA